MSDTKERVLRRICDLNADELDQFCCAAEAEGVVMAEVARAFQVDVHDFYRWRYKQKNKISSSVDSQSFVAVGAVPVSSSESRVAVLNLTTVQFCFSNDVSVQLDGCICPDKVSQILHIMAGS